MAFGPLSGPLLDPISPTEAIHLIAGAKSDDPFDPESYLVNGDEIEDANGKLFGWLSSGEIAGGVETVDGQWRRLDMVWLRSHRRLIRQWRVNPDDPGGSLLSASEAKIDRLPDKITYSDDAQVEGATWFVERSDVIECRDGLVGLIGDDRLVGRMRTGVNIGTFKNIFQASMSLAKEAGGGGTLESKAQRLRRLEKTTRADA